MIYFTNNKCPYCNNENVIYDSNLDIYSCNKCYEIFLAEMIKQ